MQLAIFLHLHDWFRDFFRQGTMSAPPTNAGHFPYRCDVGMSALPVPVIPAFWLRSAHGVAVNEERWRRRLVRSRDTQSGQETHFESFLLSPALRRECLPRTADLQFRLSPRYQSVHVQLLQDLSDVDHLKTHWRQSADS